MTLRRSLATSLSLTVSLLALGCGGDEPAAHGEHAGHANHAGHGAQPHGDDDGDSNEHSGHEGHDGHEGHEPLPALAGADQRATLFDLESVFHDPDGNEVRLADLRGGSTLVSMFYGSCTSICPLILTDLTSVMEQAQSSDLRVVVVTFDPERDTAESLLALRTERGFDPAHWKLLRGDEDATRDLAMALGVQYRRTPDGEFSHSALIALLDAEGHIIARHEGVGQPLGTLVNAARAGNPTAPLAAPTVPAPAPAP